MATHLRIPVNPLQRKTILAALRGQEFAPVARQILLEWAERTIAERKSP